MPIYVNGKKVSGMGAGVPVGGSIGQVLVKKSNYNYDTEWIDVSDKVRECIQDFMPKHTTISLPAANWTGSANPYSQVVSVNGATANSKIDLQPTALQIVELQNSDIALMADNNDGVITVYALGGKPNVDYTMQALITEVVAV